MLFLAGCGRQPASTAATEKKSQTLYTCGMHPQVIQDHPGNCPICGMKLTPIRKQPAATAAAANAPAHSGERKIKYYKSSMNPGETSPTPRKDSMGMDMVPVYEDAAAGGDSEAIAIDPVTIQTMGVRTAEVTRGPLRREIRTVGTIDYNEAALADVTTKFKGWVEKLYVDTTGQQVHRGETLFEIYSPELYSAQVEYLLATGTSTNANLGTDALRTSARNKLKFFDISDDQIAELERTRQPSKAMRIVDIKDVDVGTYVRTAQRAVNDAIAKGTIKLPTGYNVFWSGRYEYMQEANQRLAIVVPLTLLVITLIIYLNTRSAIKTAIVMLAVPFSLVGAIGVLALLHYNLSVAVWVGIIALAGLDAETGVVMLLYLDLAYDQWVREGRMQRLSDLRDSIYHGAVKRVRPKAMTAAVIIAGLAPILWSHGTGADVMKRIATPMIGGVVTSMLMELLVYPTIFHLWRSRAVKQ